MSGWIKLHRKFRKWEWYRRPETKDVFLELLLTANYEDSNFEGKIIRRGQAIVGRKALAENIGWTEQSVRTALKRLKSTNEITITSTSKFSIVTIVKYEDYQEDEGEATSTSTSVLTNNQPATNQQLTTSKEEKEIKKNKNIYTLEFETFWKSYPRKDGSKEKAFSYFQKAMAEGVSLNVLLDSCEAYKNKLKHDGTPKQYIAHGSTWLSQRRWEGNYEVDETEKRDLTTDEILAIANGTYDESRT